MRPNMPPPPYGAKIQMQSHQSSKPKSHSMQSMQQSSGSNGYHPTQTQGSSNRSLDNTNSSTGMSTYFQNRYTCGINASPESAMSPSISSVATSTSEVSHILIMLSARIEASFLLFRENWPILARLPFGVNCF